MYDINSKGELVDRVQLSPFRSNAGFAPDEVCLAVKRSVDNVHLERARVNKREPNMPRASKPIFRAQFACGACRRRHDAVRLSD